MILDPLYAHTLFNYLYGSFDGYDVSRRARIKHRGSLIKDESDYLLYGEVPFSTWNDIVRLAGSKPGGIFYDLGSGTGRVVMQSYLCHNFRKTCGVELLAGLHGKAIEKQKILDKTISPLILYHLQNKELLFLCDDILNVDLKDADLLLVNRPSTSGDFSKKLEEKILDEVKAGTKIISTIRPLENRAFNRFLRKSYQFSWGSSVAYFFVRS